MAKTHQVVVRERGTNKEVHTIDCESERSAEKVQRGVQINMDHERFYTTVRPIVAAKDGTK